MLQGIFYVLVFLLEVVLFVKVRSRRVRQLALLVGSYILYFTWRPWFAAVLVASTILNFLFGEWVRRKPSWQIVALGVLFNLALLGTFKYLPEVAVRLPLPDLQPFTRLALPLGISFWTFQGLSYLFDQYRGEELDPTLVEFALYMTFFPVTISGPVCRLPEMLPRFRSEEPLRWGEMEGGFGRIAIGVLMMQLGRLLGHGILGGDGINSAFDHLTQWSGPDVWCVALGFGLQLFFDFAGYSHIAIGAARVLGFTVPENFARPFASATPSIFWTRWHMSLSFWIRDYVFLPLAMMRRGMWWRNLVLVFSMVLFGLWHKASLLFVLWGLYHGILLVVHRTIQQAQRSWNWEPPTRIWNAAGWAATTLFVGLGWILFRANSLAKAGQMFSAAASPATYTSHFVTGSLYWLVFALGAGYGIVVLAAEALNGSVAQPASAPSPVNSGLLATLALRRSIWIPPLYLVTLISVLLVNFTQGTTAAQFMYRTF